MAEWISVIAVFWILWALDGLRLAARAVFTWRGGLRRDRARVSFGRWSIPGWWPMSWRSTVSDVPLALSPIGVCNRPSGVAGRPADVPTTLQAWRWEELREVGVAHGWIFINGARFCADTGHVTAPQLLALAALATEAREKRIRAWLRLWFRPTHLRRRARVLRGRTAGAAQLNAIALVLLAAISAYVVGDIAAHVPAKWGNMLARILPALLVYLLVLHVVAVAMSWRAVRRLKVRGAPDKRGSALMSALLLPPQGLRLRMHVGDGFFPPQHPLAAALAWGSDEVRSDGAFCVLSDLRWPIGDAADSALAREVNGWFRRALAERIAPLLAASGLAQERLFAPPQQDSPVSCRYCPRCGDQFGAGPTTCPHGVPLRALAARDVRRCGGGGR